MTDTTLRKTKADAYGISYPQGVELFRIVYNWPAPPSQAAVDRYSAAGVLESTGVLSDIGGQPGIRPGAIPLPDGWWATVDPRNSSTPDPVRVILWKAGESPRVYTAAAGALFQVMPQWDPLTERLIWMEFSGGLTGGTPYTWAVKKSTMADFPAVTSEGGSLTIAGGSWPSPAPFGGPATSIYPDPVFAHVAWLDAEYLSLECALSQTIPVGGPADVNGGLPPRHVRVRRDGASGSVDEAIPTPSSANVFGLYSSVSWIVSWLGLDGLAVGGREGAPNALRVIDSNGLWQASIWTGAIAAGQYVTAVHQRVSDGRWAVLTSDGATQRVYLGPVGATPAAAFAITGGTYGGIRYL